MEERGRSIIGPVVSLIPATGPPVRPLLKSSESYEETNHTSPKGSPQRDSRTNGRPGTRTQISSGRSVIPIGQKVLTQRYSSVLPIKLSGSNVVADLVRQRLYTL